MRIKSSTGSQSPGSPKSAKSKSAKSKTATPAATPDAATGVLSDAEQGALVAAVVAKIMSDGEFAKRMVQAIEAVTSQQVNNGPGTLLAGKVSNLSGAIQPAGGGQPMRVMVFLQGSSTASSVYVPPHLAADVATNQEVWVAPVNGRRDDLVLVGIRAFTSAPASSGYETSAHASSTYETIAHAAATYATISSDNGKVPIGPNNGHAFTLSAGTALPGSLAAYEIFVLLA